LHFSAIDNNIFFTFYDESFTMKGHAQLTSSINNSWETPPELFNILNSEFNFTLDACADCNNAKCKIFFSESIDGLTQEWDDQTVWINPPYNNTKGWVQKAVEQHHRHGITVVMLIASRTGTKVWHESIVPYAKQVRFLKGRVKFVGATSGATFDSAIVVFSTKTHFHEKYVFVDYR
jgi:site-specific DNA-methyltransferase (adenine-specific)